MAEPLLFVAGFGRCGTTMMMTMLDRGGFPVAGPRPSYEDQRLSPGRIDMDWLKAQGGKAVKYIDPLASRVSRNNLPCQPVVILMTRDIREMARSQIKLLEMTGVPIGDRRRAVRLFAKDLAAKSPTLGAVLGALGTLYSFSFEWILSDPEGAARKLGTIVSTEFGRSFDIGLASLVPLPRSPLCAPGMSMEMFGHA